MKPTAWIFAVVCLVTSTTALSQVVSLACQGSASRDDANNKNTKAPLVINLVFDLTFGKLASTNLNCWAGKGDCSVLKLRIGETSISAFGGGDLKGTGLLTSIEIDRRSGFLKLHQGRDTSVSASNIQSPQSEDAELICQGGQRLLF